MRRSRDASARRAVEATTLDGVTVTARRRVESIQTCRWRSARLAKSSCATCRRTTSGLQGAVPNLNIVPGRGSSNTVNVFIRGIGQPDSLQTFDPGVGMYADDVLPRINGALFSLFDVQQIEALRGPQGTLYGKNSTGGAIKVNTKNPSTTRGGG